MGPLVLHTPAPDYIPFEAPVKAGLLEGLQPTLHVASPMPASWNQIVAWLKQIDAVRLAA
jgi:hypothetical protein